MTDKPVKDLIRAGRVDHVSVDATVSEAVRYMAEVKRGAVAVIDGDRLVGMFSERDLMLRVVLPGKDPQATTVRDVMTRDLVVAEGDHSSKACLATMQQKHFRHLPVVEGDKLIGIVSLRDLMETAAEGREREIEMLNYYVHYSS